MNTSQIPNQTDTLFIPCLATGEKSWFSFGINGVATTCLVVFGVCGSIHSLKKLRSAEGTAPRLIQYFMALSAWDIALLISTFGFYGIATLLSGGVKPWNGPFTYCYVAFYPLVNLTMTGSVWTVLAICVERYLAISQPFRHRERKVRSAQIICLVMLIGTVLVNIPAMFELQIQSCYDDSNDLYLPQIAQSQLRTDKIFLLVYRVICYMIFLSPLPFGVVLLVTARTLCIRYTLLKSSSTESLPGKTFQCFPTPRDRTATLLTVMILKFVLCYTGPTVVNILELSESKILQGQFITHLIDICNLLVVLHSASNWLIFSRWQKNESQMTLVYKKQHLSKRQLKTVAVLCEHTKHEQLGQAVFEACFQTNPDLIKLFSPSRRKKSNVRDSTLCEDTDALFSTNERLKHQSLIAGQFICEIGHKLSSGFSKDQVAGQLRQVGHVHFRHGVNLRNNDWLSIRTCISGKLVERYAHPTAYQKYVAQKFASFIVDEVKVGFICGVQDTPVFRKKICKSNHPIV